MSRYILLVACPDQPGIVAGFTRLIETAQGNIVTDESHRDERDGAAWFVMRLVVDLEEPITPELQRDFDRLAADLNGSARCHDAAAPQRLAVLVSKEDTCVVDLLTRQRSGRLPGEIAVIIGDEERLTDVAELYGVPFAHVPFSEEQRPHAEGRMRDLIDDAGADLVVLARYMRILSREFVEAYDERIINVHHGLLPAFKGAHPYRRAWERGVKVIGATAHYATADLDDGPIIAQEVEPVDHRLSPGDLAEAGRDIERRVLAHAVKAWLEHRIIALGGRTVVFR